MTVRSITRPCFAASSKGRFGSGGGPFNPTVYESVVFDLDGTLVDTMTTAPRAYADTIRALGVPELSVEDVVRPGTSDQLRRCSSTF